MIRCLIVDDSPTFRTVLRGILASAPDVQVVGEAGDGEEAIKMALALTPDVITMDVRMPKRDGLEAIREIMRVRPTPIVVVSAAAGSDNESGINFQALKLGAIEVLGKPQALDKARFGTQSEAIRQAVRSVAGLKLITRHQRADAALPPAGAAPGRGVAVEKLSPAQRAELVAAGPRPVLTPREGLACLGIAASTGGPPALQRILSALPADYPLPIVVVQHIAEGFSEGLVRWLSEQCALRVRLAKNGEAVEKGSVLIAPDGFHLMVSMGRVRLDAGPPVKGLRPSATILFASLAREYGPHAAGLVLTGMGDDGAAGLKLMRERGAFTAAQGKASSVVFGMPNVALQTGAAELALELEDIPAALIRLPKREANGAAATPAAEPRVNGGANGKRKKLLCVDDTETILSIERVLFSDSFELVFAKNGKEAVELAEQHLPDGILMDHSMPLMTGAEALREIRSRPATKSIPVIMVSSESDRALIQSWWDHGCTAVVQKPIDQKLLVGTVRKFISS